MLQIYKEKTNNQQKSCENSWHLCFESYLCLLLQFMGVSQNNSCRNWCACISIPIR